MQLAGISSDPKIYGAHRMAMLEAIEKAYPLPRTPESEFYRFPDSMMRAITRFIKEPTFQGRLAGFIKSMALPKAHELTDELTALAEQMMGRYAYAFLLREEIKSGRRLPQAQASRALAAAPDEMMDMYVGELNRETLAQIRAMGFDSGLKALGVFGTVVSGVIGLYSSLGDRSCAYVNPMLGKRPIDEEEWAGDLIAMAYAYKSAQTQAFLERCRSVIGTGQGQGTPA